MSSNEKKINPVPASTSAASALSRVIEGKPNEVIISRLINAPRERVFSVWLAHDHLARWFGPEGFTITTHEIDVRTGGVWRFIMHGPDGTDYDNLIVYTDVTPPERIAYRQSGEAGGEPVQFETIVTFKDVGGKTELMMYSVFPTVEARNYVVEKFGAIEGGKQHLGRLAVYAEATDAA